MSVALKIIAEHAKTIRASAGRNYVHRLATTRRARDRGPCQGLHPLYLASSPDLLAQLFSTTFWHYQTTPCGSHLYSKLCVQVVGSHILTFSIMANDMTPDRRTTRSGSMAAASPPRATRVKRPPPVTPRRFRKFFAPNISKKPQITGKKPRKVLQDLRSSSLNTRNSERRTSSNAKITEFKPIPEDTDEDVAVFSSPSRKRKLDFSLSSPAFSHDSSPIKRPALEHNRVSRSPPAKALIYRDGDEEAETEEEVDDDIIAEDYPMIKRFQRLSTSASLLGLRISGRHRTRIEVEHSCDYLDEIANFYSKDMHKVYGSDGRTMTLPFCVTACNTNSLVAIGDEDGGIGLVDSSSTDSTGFSKAYITLTPHTNAVMDLDFSEDDNYIATASGDQTCHIVDVHTQKAILCLADHENSLRRVQFQPGSNSKSLVTCSRDGSLNIWDLRSTTSTRPTRLNCVHRQDGSTVDYDFGKSKDRLHNAHGFTMPGRKTPHAIATQRLSHPSVTSCVFLPSSSHLFATSSEVEATIRLWDIRATSSPRTRKPTPISETLPPPSHSTRRAFGITSLAASTTGSTLYALCRDSTVYAYSTAHLILGHAPEFDTSISARKYIQPKPALGPLYGFRHPQLQINSFYPKVSVRKADPGRGHAELLAIGSSDSCAMLFPTSPRYLNKGTEVPGSREKDGVPVYGCGVPLVRGHTKEVTGVSWTVGGELVTVADDFTARCWREDAGMARNLRVGGEGEGRRWGKGWAELPAGCVWDE